jgi:hypothetical protein
MTQPNKRVAPRQRRAQLGNVCRTGFLNQKPQPKVYYELFLGAMRKKAAVTDFIRCHRAWRRPEMFAVLFPLCKRGELCADAVSCTSQGAAVHANESKGKESGNT